MKDITRSTSMKFIHRPTSMRTIIQEAVVPQAQSLKYMSQDCSLDMQYQICSAFMKQTGISLHQRQLLLISQSQRLVQTLQHRLARYDQKQQSVESSITRDTAIGVYGNRILDVDQQSQHPSSLKRVLSRTRLHNTNRTSINSLTMALKDVQENCSRKTLSFINSLVDQHRKLSQMKSGLELKDGALRRVKDKLEHAQQQNLIMKNKMRQVEQLNKKLQLDIVSINKRGDNSLTRVSSRSSLHKHVQQSNLHETENQSYTLIKEYLKEKQHLIEQKEQKLKGIDQQIIGVFTGRYSQQVNCQRCCALMKKLKESIMKYKVYMESQMQGVQGLYQNYKRLFLAKSQ